METLALAWQLLTQDASPLWPVFLRSLLVSGVATLVAAVLGLCAGAWVAVHRFVGRAWLLGLGNTLLALPSVVVGLLVYLLLSRSGPLGFMGWLYSLKAMIVAQAILVFPVVLVLTRQCIEQAERAHGEQLRALGAGSAWRAVLLAWDERWALGMVLLTAFGRAISEVGAVMIVGGNIEGYTRVMTTSIALETSKGDLPMALALGALLLGLVTVLNVLVHGLHQWAHWPAASLRQSSGSRAS
jgi:tungstate transport system permease protein